MAVRQKGTKVLPETKRKNAKKFFFSGASFVVRESAHPVEDEIRRSGCDLGQICLNKPRRHLCKRAADVVDIVDAVDVVDAHRVVDVVDVHDVVDAFDVLLGSPSTVLTVLQLTVVIFCP